MNARNKTRLIVASVAVAVLAAAIVIHWLANRGPNYQGKDISYWFDHPRTMTPLATSAGSLEGEAFRAMGPAAVPYLTKMLRENNWWENFYSTQCSKHWKQLPLWIQTILPRPTLEIYRRVRAASLLENMGPSARTAAPDLIKVYRAEYAKAAGSRTSIGMLRERLIQAVAAVGGEDPEIVPVLLIAMIEPDDQVQGQAHIALGNINVIAAVKKCVPDLVETLDNPQAKMRYSAAALLGLTTSERHEAILPLVRALSDEDETVGFAAGNSLRNAGRDALLPVLHDALQSQNDRLRWNAAVFLNEWGPDEAKRTVPVLMQALLRHSNSRFRAKAAVLLGQLGPEGKEAIPALTQALQDQDALVRDRAADALKKIQMTEGEQ